MIAPALVMPLVTCSAPSIITAAFRLMLPVVTFTALSVTTASVLATLMVTVPLGSVISRYFENSYLGAVSALVEEEKISLGELRSLIDRIENQNR